MSGRAIIIADADARYLGQAANYFQNGGYRCETAGSIEELLTCLFNKKASVLLLGSSLAGTASLVDLVDLLKTVNSRLRIILVSDAMTLFETREVREAGVFYHALKPETAYAHEELAEAVACAFGGRMEEVASLQEEPVPVPVVDSAVKHVAPRMPFAWIAGLVALALGAGAISLQAKSAGAGSLTVWIFLGFFALIITNQLLPIFRVKLVQQGHKGWRAALSGVLRGEK